MRSPELDGRLDVLRKSHQKVVGKPFEHFLCPMTFQDKDVELCQAHLINGSFPNSSSRWTVQRADIDNWYGQYFESDFVKLRHQGLSPAEAFADKSATRELRPRITHHGEEIGYYKPTGSVPVQHSEIHLQLETKSVRLAVKFEPNKMLQTSSGDWHVEIDNDLRLPSLVSLLKAAHLTLFDMLGYEYALTAGAFFVGQTILGHFFVRNRGSSKVNVQESASTYFSEYANLVRPVSNIESVDYDTIAERTFCIVEGLSRWAFLVFLRVAGSVHAVLIPLLESPDAAARFVRFLKEETCTFKVRRALFDGQAFQVSPETHSVYWPKSKFSD